jgi:hypothetical protein
VRRTSHLRFQDRLADGSRLLWSILLATASLAPGGVSDDRAAPVDPNRSHEDATATKYLPDEVVTVAVESKPSPDNIWQAVSLASGFVRHAETIAQTRFNNLLVADSLLLLAWATSQVRTAALGLS